MGCFLECFGPPKKGRRRRVRARRSQPGERLQEHVEPLLPTSVLTQKVATEERVPEKKEQPEFRPVLRKGSGRSISSILKKKVTFDLDVKTYEALPYDEDPSLSLDKNELLKEKTKEEQQEEEQKLPPSHIVLAYPLNHRYRNCMNVDDEEDFEQLEYDDEGDHEEEDFEDEEDGDGRYFDDGKLDTVDLENQDEDLYDSHFSLQLERDCQFHGSITFTGSNFESFQNTTPSPPSSQGARNTSQYVHSILNSVENFSQWKEAKAKEMPSKQHLELEEKENDIVLVGKAPLMSCATESSFNSQKVQLNWSRRTSSHLRKELAIDASLSNWLTPLNN